MKIKTFFEALNGLLGELSIRKRFPKYVFHKSIFYAYIGLLALIVLLLFQQYGINEQTYFRCDFGNCITPDGFEVRAPYVQGNPPPTIIKYFGLYTITGLALMFGLNHLLFNTRLKK
jgi:hypothetical protein